MPRCRRTAGLAFANRAPGHLATRCHNHPGPRRWKRSSTDRFVHVCRQPPALPQTVHHLGLEVHVAGQDCDVWVTVIPAHHSGPDPRDLRQLLRMCRAPGHLLGTGLDPVPPPAAGRHTHMCMCTTFKSPSMFSSCSCARITPVLSPTEGAMVRSTNAGCVTGVDNRCPGLASTLPRRSVRHNTSSR